VRQGVVSPNRAASSGRGVAKPMAGFGGVSVPGAAAMGGVSGPRACMRHEAR